MVFMKRAHFLFQLVKFLITAIISSDMFLAELTLDSDLKDKSTNDRRHLSLKAVVDRYLECC